MKKIFTVLSIAALAATSAVASFGTDSLSNGSFAVEAAAGYAFNKKFHGPTASLKGKYNLTPISSKLSHGLSLEVMAGMSKATKSGALTELKKVTDVNGVTKTSTGRNINEVKVTQVPVLLNYDLAYALDHDSKWKITASAGAGVQYFFGEQTNKHELAVNGEVVKVADKKAAYKGYFGTDTGSNKYKKKYWKPVAKLALGLQYDTEKWNAFVRGFALISKSTTWTTPVPKAAPAAAGAKAIAPATLKWGGVQFGAEAGIGIKF